MENDLLFKLMVTDDLVKKVQHLNMLADILNDRYGMPRPEEGGRLQSNVGWHVRQIISDPELDSDIWNSLIFYALYREHNFFNYFLPHLAEGNQVGATTIHVPEGKFVYFINCKLLTLCKMFLSKQHPMTTFAEFASTCMYVYSVRDWVP